MLRSRLTLGLLPLLLLFLAVCLYAFRASQDFGGAVQVILDRNFQSIARVKEMRLALAQMNDALGQIMTPAGARDASRNFTAARARFKRSLTDEMLASPAPAKAALLNELDDQFGRFTEAAEFALRGAPFDLVGRYGHAEGAFLQVGTVLEQVLESDHEEIRTAGLRIQVRTEETLRLLFAAMLVAVGLFFFLAWRLGNSLLAPIKALTESAVALGQGDLEREVPVTSRDELGQLAKAFNAMAVHLRAYREATLGKVLRTQRTIEATLTSAPDPVFVVSTDGTHTVRNPAAEQLAQSPGFEQGFPPALAQPLARVMATGDHYLPTDYGRAVNLRVAREDRHYLPRILAIGDKLTEFKGAAIILQDVTKFRLLDDAKTNLVGTVSHNGTRVIAALSGLANDRERAEEARKLLDWGSRSFQKTEIFAKDEVVGEAQVFGGAKSDLALKANGPVDIFLPIANRDKLTARIVYQGPVSAPVEPRRAAKRKPAMEQSSPDQT